MSFFFLAGWGVLGGFSEAETLVFKSLIVFSFY